MSSTIQQVARPLPAPPPQSQDEPRFLLHNISWQFYESFLKELAKRPRLRLTYDRGSLELMTISSLHEWYKRILDRLILALAMELRVPIRSGGSATFTRPDLLRGLEPDECYWVHSAHLMKGRREVDLTRDPIFELAIEIELSPADIDRMEVYAALGVAEVWRFSGTALRVCLLQPDHTYADAEESSIFPGVPLEEIVRLVNQGLDAEDDIALMEAYRTWVREHVLPGRQGTTPSP
jgi:Uma2 family endonuclease